MGFTLLDLLRLILDIDLWPRHRPMCVMLLKGPLLKHNIRSSPEKVNMTMDLFDVILLKQLNESKIAAGLDEFDNN